MAKSAGENLDPGLEPKVGKAFVKTTPEGKTRVVVPVMLEISVDCPAGSDALVAAGINAALSGNLSGGSEASSESSTPSND